jgi:hypothetical protein
MASKEPGMIRLKTTLGLLVVVIVIYLGVKLFPFYVAEYRLSQRMSLYTRRVYNERSAGLVRESLYRDAQELGIPLRYEDIRVEATSTGAEVVTADYTAPLDLHFFQPALHFHLQYPDDKRRIALSRIRILEAVGITLGLFWFFKGFLILWKYRTVADTPVVPIRSIAMGLVQVRGKAVGEKTLLSPVSRIPCFLYKVKIDRWSSDLQGSGGWSPYVTDAAWVPFYLQDETGRVRVEPRSAEFDLDQTAQSEISTKPATLLGHGWEADPAPVNLPGYPPSDSELRRYVLRVAEGMRSELYQGADLSQGGSPGTSERTGPNVFQKALLFLRPALAFLFPQRMAGLGYMPVLASADHPRGYRLTELCILPDRPYDITGTCEENPEAIDEHDRSIIAKGKNSSTFLISCRSEKALEGDLRARTLRNVLGGGLLAIGCTAALLQNLGYL